MSVRSEFKTPFQTFLPADNRWVKLSKVVPWDKFASAYMSMMTVDFGRPGISPIRKRAGHEIFDSLNVELIKSVSILPTQPTMVF